MVSIATSHSVSLEYLLSRMTSIYSYARILRPKGRRPSRLSLFGRTYGDHLYIVHLLSAQNAINISPPLIPPEPLPNQSQTSNYYDKGNVQKVLVWSRSMGKPEERRPTAVRLAPQAVAGRCSNATTLNSRPVMDKEVEVEVDIVMSFGLFSWIIENEEVTDRTDPAL